MEPPSALVVDDDTDFRESLVLLVEREGFRTRGAGSLAEARAALEERSVDVALLDLRLPDGNGLEFASEAEELGCGGVVVITGDADVDSAVDALRKGVVDYLQKPLDRARLRASLASVARTRALREEVDTLRGELRGLGRFGEIVGRSPAMQAVFDMIARVAPTRASVLITGESGTGKEVVARTIHRLSKRKDGPMEAVNCGAIPESLIESELFGHEKGSFTGADRARPGFFERADGGTLFLDEITEMPVELQVRLLRVLETGEVQRVGANERRRTNVRVLAATNRDPRQAVEDARLREDLFYRLAVFPIELPPLREREGDVALLATRFLEELNEEYGEPKSWTSEALERLAELPFEGNVRELRNLVQRAYIMAERVITVDALPDAEPTRPSASRAGVVELPVGRSIAEAEQRLIEATLEHTGGNKKAAAELLGISLKTLYSRLKVYAAAASD